MLLWLFLFFHFEGSILLLLAADTCFLRFLQGILQTIIVYYTIKFQGLFIYLVLVIWAVAIASGAVAILLGCLVKDPKQAVELAPLVFVPQLLFVGFYIRTSLIPSWIRWIQYLCPLKYGVDLVFLLEYVPSTGLGRENWEKMLQQNHIELSSWWIYALVLVSIYVACKLLSTIALSRMVIT